MRLADRYEVLRRIGEGGGGGVYLVRDRLADGAEMVLKRLHTRAQAGVAQWLVNEFQILAQLDMPTVARVFDFGLAEADAEDPGGAFFTREYVDGVPLDATPSDPSTLSSARLAEIFGSAAETLRALHRLGVVHGDLKPANLVVPREGGGVVLIDFGLAHGALGAAERVRGGTLAFMPPERRELLFSGESLAPDPRADLYALSLSMLVLLGLSSPEAPEPAWAAMRPELAALIDFARRGASPDPERRYATADDFLAALARVSAGSVPAARAPLPARIVLRPEGRESELGDALEHVARRLIRREGGAASVLVVGDEGSGRSTLLRELTWRAQLRGVQVLHVQGEPGDAPARRLRQGATVLSGEALESNDADALVTAFRRAARKAPLLLLADDLDQADPAIAAQLRSLAYGCEPGDAILVMAATADESIASCFAPGARIALGPLDEPAVAALCAQILGPVEPGVVSAVRARTGGLPLAVSELLVALASAGAVTVADVERVEIPARAKELARRRVLALPEQARRAAAALAALGVAAEPAIVAEVCSSSSDLDAARTCGLLTLRANGRLSLSHGALAEPLLESLAPELRAELARRAADALEHAEVPSSVRARAWVRARDAARALAHAGSATADLRAAGLPGAAAQLWASIRALDASLATPDRVFTEAELCMEAGALEDAARLCETLASCPDADVALRALLLRGRALSALGDAAGASAALSQGLDRARDANEAGEFLRELAHVDFRAGSYALAAQRCEAGLSRALAPRVCAGLLALWGLSTSYLGDQTRAVELLERALGLYGEAGDVREEAKVLAYLAIAKDRAGDLLAARALYERTLERARAIGDVGAMASARLNLGGILDRMGDLASALEHYGAAAKLAQRAGRPDTDLAARLNTAGELVRLGSYERARAELEGVIASAKQHGYRDIVAHALDLLGLALARLGELDAGLERLAEALDTFAAIGFAEGVAEVDFDVAEILLDRGAPEDISRVAERLAHAREALPELGVNAARAHALEGRLALARGDARAAQKLLGEAVDRAERSSQWEVLAQALGARAAAYQAMGADIHARRDRERAIEVLESTAALLPPDLRSAFWSVPQRAFLRAALVSETSQDVLARHSLPFSSLSSSLTAISVHAPTLAVSDQRLVLLLELSRRVGEETTLERVLDQAVRSAVELTNAERGAVLLVGPDGRLSVRARLGMGEGPDEAFSRSIAETVLIDGEPVATLDARGDRRFADYRSVHDLAIGAVAAVPIRARGRTLGVLYVENRLRRALWSASDVALMRAFAEQAGVAVEHARLIEELEARTRELEAATREIQGLLALRTSELEDARNSLRRAEDALKSRFAPQGVVAQSEPMRKLFALLDRVRESDLPVVVEGESGTGKELLARAIHFGGPRQKGPFIVVHCGAIPETLLESELFGHVRGAFTGAERDRRGLIASAQGGTLLLDEVAEMPLKMQVELLRVLQDRRVRPVGSEREEEVDVRIIATTHRPLQDLVAEGRFREDLYYRLSVVTLRIPPLRARLDDVPLLASHFLQRFAEEHHMPRKRLTREALNKLLRAPWPGNVRQLRHVLESAAVLAEDDTIGPEQLVLTEASSVPLAPGSSATMTAASASPLAIRKAAERQRILDALEQVNWNKVRAAALLGMPRRTLYRRLREYGLLDE